MLETGLHSFARAVCALNPRAVPPSPKTDYLNLFVGHQVQVSGTTLAEHIPFTGACEFSRGRGSVASPSLESLYTMLTGGGRDFFVGDVATGRVCILPEIPYYLSMLLSATLRKTIESQKQEKE